MSKQADDWKAAVEDVSLCGLAAAWMKELEQLLPPESGTIVIYYNKQGDPAHIVTVALNDELGDSLRILHEATALIRGRTAATSGGEREFVAGHSGIMKAGGAPSAHLISSARVSKIGAHEVVRLWSRGALAGELVVNDGDGDMLCALLGMINHTAAAGYERDLDAMVVAARAWRQANPSAVLALDWPDPIRLGPLVSYVNDVAGNIATVAYLTALDDAAGGRATVLMAQAATEATVDA